MTQQRITDQELDAMIAALTRQGSKIGLEIAQDLKDARTEISTYREHRYYASEFLGCQEKLKKYEQVLRSIAEIDSAPWVLAQRKAQEALR